MAIRKHPTKGPGWWQIIISNGRSKPQDVYPFEGSEAEARSFEADLKGVPQESNEQRLYDVLGRYLDWADNELAKNTVKDRERCLPQIIDRIGNKPLSLLRQHDYDLYKRKRLEDGVKKRTINIELTMLRGLLTYAAEELKIHIGEKPKLYTKKQTAPPAKIVLTPEEIGKLIAQLKGDKKTIVMLYAFCGLRRNEGLLLQRKNVDLEAGLLHITGKGEKARVVPIVGAELLQRLTTDCKGKKQDDYLFTHRAGKKKGQPYLNIKKSLIAAAKRAGITKPVWNHLMRHSGATAAITAGVNLRSLQTMLGHSDIRMTELYTHLAADVLKEEAAKLAKLHDSKKQPSEMSAPDQSKKSNVIPLHRKLRQ